MFGGIIKAGNEKGGNEVIEVIQHISLLLVTITFFIGDCRKHN